MTTCIALLRGINVGGHHKLPMKDLRELLTELGLGQVRTYIQSGNIVFRSTDPAGAEQAIAETIDEAFGFRPQILVLTHEEFAAAVENNPYPEAIEEPKSLHVYFLAATPLTATIDAMVALKKDSESFALDDRVFYLYAPDGIARSKLAANVEKLLGVPATARNWRTVNAILELADAQ